MLKKLTGEPCTCKVLPEEFTQGRKRGPIGTELLDVLIGIILCLAQIKHVEAYVV